MPNSLQLAILAMDSYNQGYNRGLETGTTQVGNAKVLGPDSGVPSDLALLQSWQDNGFYAAAYSVGGEVVISYRGSDDLQDAWNDFQSIALGPTGIIPAQVELAAKFYTAVKAANPGKNIVLTGHSLGGALAGIIAKVNGIDACLFNNISFENVADNVHYYAALTDQDIDVISSIGSSAQALRDKRAWARDTFYGGLPPTTLNPSRITAYGVTVTVHLINNLKHQTHFCNIRHSGESRNPDLLKTGA